ncbi:Putative glycosyltransferase EpsF [Rosistilla carotiformis]|uniref:Glycosyltransferase EpsF n=1 Tax=Rosistilla carotiformis TaxID=2528017 RepID=A0A518JVG7_9BACT|nr:glycosyltransferase family 4 protein [Rosistilla carotiformis]QDV69541.1 Putative glycosyltransferase EpsF [Rosistilla carotiformis]
MNDRSTLRGVESGRFLFVLGQYAKLGGAERQAIILADQLKRRVGCHVEFLAWGGEGRVASEIRELGVEPRIFPLNWNRGRISQLITLRLLQRYLRNELRPDYILPYIGFNCKIIGMVWRQSRARFTWWNQRDEGRDIYGSKLEHKIIHSVPSVVSNSYEGRDFLVSKFGITENRIHVLNNGIVLPQRFDSSHWRETLGIHSDQLLITMLANLTQFKDHTTLLKAFAQLRKTDIGKGCHLALAGRLAESTDLLKVLAFDLGLCGSVHFLGPVAKPASLWSATDFAVHSSETEGCPNAALEAMAHGLAVCGTNISGMRQAVGDTEAVDVLASPRDGEGLFRIMHRLASSSSERLQRGERNRRRIVQHFSPEGLTERVLQLIDEHQVF